MDHPEIPTIEWCFGAGGNHLGLKRIVPGLRLVALSEIEAYAAVNVVAKMEAGLLEPAPNWTDCRTFPCELFRDRLALFLASYPCQGESTAGKRLGDRDPRWLWPAVRRGVEEMQPLRCFFENVEGHLTKGLRQVCRDLEALGRRVAVGIFSAEEVGYPHRRKRVFIMPDLAGDGCARLGLSVQQGRPRQNHPHPLGSRLPVAHPEYTERGPEILRAEFSEDSASLKPCSSYLAYALHGERDCRPSGVRWQERLGTRVGYPDVAYAKRYRWPQGAQDLRGGESVSSLCLPLVANASGPGFSLPELQALLGAERGPLQSRAASELRPPERPPGPGLGGHRVLDDIRDLLTQDPGAAWQRYEAERANTFAWAEILAHDPSLEPAVCRVAHGLAHRVDRLRLGGNGVVSDTATLAYLTLSEALST